VTFWQLLAAMKLAHSPDDKRPYTYHSNINTRSTRMQAA